MQVAAPLLVGLLLVALWEMGLPRLERAGFLLPKPSDVAAKLAEDWRGLLGALGVTLRIAFQAFAAAVILGTLIAFLFVQSRADRDRACSPTRCCCR